ncbi:DUF1810 domain-containing protein [Caenimonas sedimenti]|uniref:DUF1810 domain-containing protein n=2 Tax=Caenimonas sedimenti TaxID=2596921 RepID=A0A562ZQG1_9BURK|nr:DUF1810 domain-containing protein [Caenimonas sedimenti]
MDTMAHVDADPHQLERFVAAQAPMIEAVRAELRAARKTSHWMWFVFPQLTALGRSQMARHYGLASVEEARAYLAHPVLGPRLRECCTLMLQAPGHDAHAILGSPDDLKFRSCVTLFGLAEPAEPLFAQCLRKFYGGQADPRTLELCA